MSKDRKSGWEPQSFLQALRPAPGEVVDFAVLTTYSADLVVVAAALLALAGFDGDDGTESKVDLIDAYDRLKDRVVILHQNGRLAVPGKKLAVLKLLDSVVRGVKVESGSSFHPKIALVRYHIAEEPSEFVWRIWLGSRNLTRSASWELGFCAESSVIIGQTIPGIEELGSKLAAAGKIQGFSADLVRRELKKLSWKTPRGVQVVELKLWDVGEVRSLPEPPAEIDEISVISPFIDGSILSEVGRWGTEKTKRIVVSTLPELKRLSQQKTDPLKGFLGGIRYLDSPEDDLVIPEESEAADSETDFRSLHAKALFFSHGKRYELWFGSGNATVRGLKGPNSEVFVRAKIDDDVAVGIESFLKNRTVEVQNADLIQGKAAQRSTEFELACDFLASTWNLRQQRKAEGFCIIGDINPHSVLKNATIQASHLGQVLSVWPDNSLSMTVTLRNGQETEFIAICARRGEEERQWLQVAPIEGFDRRTRDRAIVFDYLDPKAFLGWLKMLLDGGSAENGGGRWDQKPVIPPTRPEPDAFQLWNPSLEQVLRAYIRNRQQLKRVDALIGDYMEYIEKERPELVSDQALRDLREVWPVLKTHLIGRSAKAGVD